MTLINILLIILSLTGIATTLSFRPLPDNLEFYTDSVRKQQIVDRYGEALNITYRNNWNVHNHVVLHEVPAFLRQAFILAEDRRFFTHNGADWIARINATRQNMLAGRAVRGASTISEQVVRMIHPRPRTLWSRWIEGFEALQLEKRFSKLQILEFYLNQVPYARQQRGIVQASHYYFDRDLELLDYREMLALAVMIRAPSLLEPGSHSPRLDTAINRLAENMHKQGYISSEQLTLIMTSPLERKENPPRFEARHFAEYIYQLNREPQSGARLHTTLDPPLQNKISNLLENRLQSLHRKNVNNAALLVVDNHSNEILVWVNAGNEDSTPGYFIDAITTPRQPGSAIKPFIYALALEKGWTAATIIDDSPHTIKTGAGQHTYRNYSRHYHGPIRLRTALANSLNIPAVKALEFVGLDNTLSNLHALGMKSLTQDSNHYGTGLALGNGEITLLELAQAYTTLANRGRYRTLSVLKKGRQDQQTKIIFSAETASLITDILSDNHARTLEFGTHSALAFPRQTAIKTGTSNDHRNAWAIAYNNRFTVAAWMGNLDNTAMHNITGSSGPAPLLRSVFMELNRHYPSGKIYLSRKLKRRAICHVSGKLAGPDCPTLHEWFTPHTLPEDNCPIHGKKTVILTEENNHNDAWISQPTSDLQLALDPRIPDDLERFEMTLKTRGNVKKIEWLINGNKYGTGSNTRFLLWPLKAGDHTVSARILFEGTPELLQTREIPFSVKP